MSLMKRPLVFLATFAGAAVLLLAFPEHAQEATEMPSLAVEQHARLASEAGTWTAKCTWHGPQGPFDFEGKETVIADCGGLWVFASFESEFAGSPFKGRGVTGYDVDAKKVVGAWVDSASTSLMRLEGQFEGEKLVLNTQGKDPMTGETYPEKHVHTYKGKDERVLEMIALRDGAEHLLMRITYTRSK